MNIGGVVGYVVLNLITSESSSSVLDDYTLVSFLVTFLPMRSCVWGTGALLQLPSAVMLVMLVVDAVGATQERVLSWH